MTHLMVDIETLGTRPGSAIASIGAVIFDEKKILQEFECNIDLKSCVDAGMTMDPDTIVWWMKQSSEAISATFGQLNTTPVKDALTALFEFCQDEGVDRFWSHGATFDIVLLSEAALMCGVEPFCNYYLARDTRTLYEMTGVDVRDFRGAGTHHRAIDDARAQALAVIEASKRIAKWKDNPYAAVTSLGQPLNTFGLGPK